MSNGVKIFVGLALVGLIYFAVKQSKKSTMGTVGDTGKPMVINNRI